MKANKKIYCDHDGNPIDARGDVIQCDTIGEPISRACLLCGTLEANTLSGFWDTSPPTCEDCFIFLVSLTHEKNRLTIP